MDTNNVLDSIKKSIITRVFVVGGIIMVMLIPFAMIESLIYERQERGFSVVREINSRWAFEQTVTGPVLEVPYLVRSSDGSRLPRNGGEKKIKRIATFLPAQLTITGSIMPENRYRGIYKSNVYTADLEIKGSFEFPAFEELKIDVEDILWEEAAFSFGISDMRGINKNVTLEWNIAKLTPEPGVRNKDVFKSGISCFVPLDTDLKKNHSFAMRLNLRGSTAIHFLPVGKKTDVLLDSSWPSPSFSGAFLPKTRVIDKNGFKARWEVFYYNREYPQQWTEKLWDIGQSGFGLYLYEPVDQYQKTSRSIKYAVLFIALTFLAFFLLIELYNRRRIHPIQYLLVGTALAIFYLLLLSLSEHMPFDAAYLVAALSIIVITTVYARSVSGKWSLTFYMWLFITGLYGFLYVMLQLEDYSLLMGSVGLFAILAVIMVSTRKIDWYSFKIEKKNSALPDKKSPA